MVIRVRSSALPHLQLLLAICRYILVEVILDQVTNNILEAIVEKRRMATRREREQEKCGVGEAPGFSPKR